MLTTFFGVAANAPAVGAAKTAAPTLAMTIRWRRFMVAPFSQCKSFCVDETGGNVGIAHVLSNGICHRGRPADVDLALGDVRDDLPQMFRRQKVATLVGLVVSDNEAKVDSARSRETLELLAK